MGAVTVRYDAFISYSHSADHQLAPAIQDGLQKLAKPWNRRRALDIFRDETGLSANPALWTSIEQALDESRWFVLLLSPESAGSEWVGKEIEHWLATKPHDHILPVLTEGELRWDPRVTGFDPAVSTALPPALVGAFREEPRHLDLRWARDQTQLDLRNSTFRGAIADLAAPIHGIPKDDLEGEDVRLHKRAKRLSRMAVAALVILLVSSLAAGALAFSNARRADLAADDARKEAARARAAEAVAEEERDRATEQQLAAQAAQAEAEAALAAQLTAEELAQVEAERAAEQEELAALNAQESDRRTLCNNLATLFIAEARRGAEFDDGHPPYEQDRGDALAAMWEWGGSHDVTGLPMVAIDAMADFPLEPEFPPYLPLPDDLLYSFEYTADPVRIGAESDAYWYYEGPVTMTYSEAYTEIDAYFGALCREVGLL